MQATASGTRRSIEAQIAQLHDQERGVAVEIGKAFVSGLQLEQLRARRRDIREMLEDLYAALTVVQAGPSGI